MVLCVGHEGDPCLRSSDCSEGYCCARHFWTKICKPVLRQGEVCTKQRKKGSHGLELFQRCDCAKGLACKVWKDATSYSRSRLHICQRTWEEQGSGGERGNCTGRLFVPSRERGREDSLFPGLRYMWRGIMDMQEEITVRQRLIWASACVCVCVWWLRFNFNDWGSWSDTALGCFSQASFHARFFLFDFFLLHMFWRDLFESHSLNNR